MGAEGNGGEWNVSAESVERLRQLAQLLKDIAGELAGTVSALKDDFGENEEGLGAHSEDIILLIEEMEKLAGESAAVVNKLSFKLLKAATVRQSHIDNAVYSGKIGGALGAGALTAGMAGAAAGSGAAARQGAGNPQIGLSGGIGENAGGSCTAGGENAGSSSSASGNGETGTSASGETGMSASGEFTSMIASLEGEKVSYRPIEPAPSARTTEQIVERLSGGDLTEGSCSSLAFAYVGNKAGYDVLDFRDGKSRVFFATRDSIRKIACLPGVKSRVICGRDDLDSAGRLFAGMESGKEYYLAIGQHAAIVRRDGDHIGYLELQHPSDGNGWQTLSGNILRERFGCLSTWSSEIPSFLMEVDSLAKCREFLKLLGFINTEGSKQRKGGSGNVR